MVKHLPIMWETWVQSLGWEDPLEKEMATHSNILAWKIPRAEEPGRLQSMGLQRVGRDWATSLLLSLGWRRWGEKNKWSTHHIKLCPKSRITILVTHTHIYSLTNIFRNDTPPHPLCLASHQVQAEAGRRGSSQIQVVHNLLRPFPPCHQCHHLSTTAGTWLGTACHWQE